jgi:hypothetical protein
MPWPAAHSCRWRRAPASPVSACRRRSTCCRAGCTTWRGCAPADRRASSAVAPPRSARVAGDADLQGLLQMARRLAEWQRHARSPAQRPADARPTSCSSTVPNCSRRCGRHERTAACFGCNLVGRGSLDMSSHRDARAHPEHRIVPTPTATSISPTSLPTSTASSRAWPRTASSAPCPSRSRCRTCRA